MRSRSSSSEISSVRTAVVDTVVSHEVTRSGGSSLTFSTATACVRALDSSRAYASEMYGLSEYDVSSFCATDFQTPSNPSTLPSGEAATSSRLIVSSRSRSVLSPTSA